MSLPLSISAPLDSAVLQFGMIEQVSGLTDAAIQVSGTTATRTYSAEFRWSNDNALWSSWMAFTTPMLQAISPNEDLPFYIEIRVTRTGSDNTGAIVWEYCSFGVNIDDQAVSGFGKISQGNIIGDLKEYWTNLIQSWVYKYDGADNWEVKYIPNRWTYSTNKPTVYLTELVQLDQAREGSSFKQNWQIRVGFKPVKNKTVGLDEMQSRWIQTFSPWNFGRFDWSFTFKGVDFINARMSDFGIHDVSPSGMVELNDEGTHEGWRELTLSFSVKFDIFN